MGARGTKASKKTKRRAHKKTPEQREALLQNLLREAAARKNSYGRG